MAYRRDSYRKDSYTRADSYRDGRIYDDEDYVGGGYNHAEQGRKVNYNLLILQ